MKNYSKIKIVVGMSGGVDSSMALVLLKKQGFEPVGVSLKYAVWKNKDNLLRENVCCSAQSFRVARDICKELKVSYYIFDVKKEFKKEVIDYFLKELKGNKTPNPCIICNRWLKFKKLFEWAKEHNIEYVATGHYAKVQKNSKTQKYELKRAKDKKKDQTYSLCLLPQKWLKNTVFPLADYTKSEVYKIAKQKGFEIFLKQKQSQDFCFVAGKSMECFLRKEVGERKGIIKDDNGNVLGKHEGLHFYTIGQRKGINLSGGPYFVLDMDPLSNVLIVTKNENNLFCKELVLSNFHFISDTLPKKKIRVEAKIRSHHPLASAILFPSNKNRLKLVFDKSQKAVAPGQYVVFYNKNICLGGGRIIKGK